MTTLTKEDVRDVVNEVLDERTRVGEPKHTDHHQFMQMQIERYEAKKRLRESVKKQVIGWGVIVALGGIGTAVYSLVMNAVSKAHL